MPQILVENLTKTYRLAKRQAGLWNAFRSVIHREFMTVHALEGISFSMEKGELAGYIGPNGAGKSTTVKILSGILVPDSGRCMIMDRIPWKQRVEHVSHIGVVFGQRTQLWWDVPVIDSFELLRDIYKIPSLQYEKTRTELVDRLDIGNLLEIPVRQLSLGQRMKCDLAASLLHSPPLLFLDEPTIGLDAVSKLAVREFIRGMNREQGTTVILTTHDMDDIEALCSRIMVIGKGRILSDGTLDGLRNQVSKERRLTVDLDQSAEGFEIRNATIVKKEGSRVCLSYDPEVIPTAGLISLISNRYPVRDLFVENPPIDEIIARLYTELKI